VILPAWATVAAAANNAARVSLMCVFIFVSFSYLI
jgi:hypothetical protein